MAEPMEPLRTEEMPPAGGEDMQQQALNKRLEMIGWGLFLIMLGGLGLIPGSLVPEGTWLIGAGLILLGLNLARYLNKIPISGFTTVLGVIALLVGVGDFLGVDLPLFPILLILFGAGLLLKPLLEKR